MLERDYRVSQIVIQSQSENKDNDESELNYSLIQELKEDVKKVLKCLFLIKIDAQRSI